MTTSSLNRSPRATGFVVVALVAAVTAVAQSFGRFTFGVLLPAIADNLDLSNTVAGFLGMLNVGAYLVGTLCVSALANQWKLLRIMRVGFVLALAGLAVTAYSPNEWVLGAAMFASGFGGAFIWIPAPVIGAAALPPEKRSLAVGLIGSGMGAGVVIASLLSRVIRSSMGDDSWRTVYGILAVASVVIISLAAFVLDHDQETPGGRGGFGGVDALRRMNGWKALTAAYTAFGFMYLLVLAFLTKRLEEDSGWTGSQAAVAFTVVGIAMMFGGPFFTSLSGKLGSRITLTVAFTLWAVAVLSLLPGWYLPSLPLSFLIGMLFAGIPTMITLYVVQNTRADDYGPAFAAATLAFGIAQMVSPQIGGFIADWADSFTLVFVLSAVVGLTGAVASLNLPRVAEQHAEELALS